MCFLPGPILKKRQGRHINICGNVGWCNSAKLLCARNIISTLYHVWTLQLFVMVELFSRPTSSNLFCILFPVIILFFYGVSTLIDNWQIGSFV